VPISLAKDLTTSEFKERISYIALLITNEATQHDIQPLQQTPDIHASSTSHLPFKAKESQSLKTQRSNASQSIPATQCRKIKFSILHRKRNAFVSPAVRLYSRHLTESKAPFYAVLTSTSP
jgi:hypothetical protein